MIKKAIALCFSLILILMSMVGCSPQDNQNDKLSIVCSIFPHYDWTKQILGETVDEIDLTLLVNNGTDLHSYQPSAQDILKISTCDMFIYVGGSSDQWVDEVLEQANNDEMIVIDLLNLLGEKAKEEVIIEGMEHEHEHEHDEEEAEYDEHIWLSIKNASFLCEKICEQLCTLIPENAESYQKNSDVYIKKLNSLDNEYSSAIGSAKRNSLIFADRFPFRYLADDYGLDCYAAFPGCSAETEASFKTVAFLAEKSDEEKVPALLIIDGSSDSIAKTVVETSSNKDCKILSVNSLQSVTQNDIENGVTYLSVMTKNLEIFKEVLN